MRKLGKILLWTIGGLVGLVAVIILISFIFYPPSYIYRVLVWQQSDVNDYLTHFPNRPLTASPAAFHFTDATSDNGVSDVIKTVAATDDIDGFFESTDTQAFIVIQNDEVLFENYYNGTSRDTLATSFSVAKSFTSALVGIAIDEGYINSVDDPITDYLPELLDRDARFQNITIRNLLMMASGLDYKADRIWIVNGDDALTTYYPDQRKAALEFTNVLDDPGLYFKYNKYHPQLLGLILERTTGVNVTTYLQTKIWDRIGTEYGGSWSLDSTKSGFEKMESGINARPIDFAKFGRLYLNNGSWDGAQLISPGWVADSTQVDQATYQADYYRNYPEFFNDGGYYKYFFWAYERSDGTYDFSAEGDHGQLIFVSPSRDLIIVRNGFNYGDIDWLKFAHEMANQMAPVAD